MGEIEKREFIASDYTIKELKEYVSSRLVEIESSHQADRPADLPILAEEVDQLIEALKADSRKGASRLAESLEKKQLAASIDLKPGISGKKWWPD